MPFPTLIPKTDWPERTPENIPDEIVEQVLDSVKYRACGNCDEEQWMVQVVSHNTTHTCINCDAELMVVG